MKGQSEKIPLILNILSQYIELILVRNRVSMCELPASEQGSSTSDSGHFFYMKGAIKKTVRLRVLMVSIPRKSGAERKKKD